MSRYLPHHTQVRSAMWMTGVIILVLSALTRCAILELQGSGIPMWPVTEFAWRLLPSWFERTGEVWLWDLWHAVWGAIMVFGGLGAVYYTARLGLPIVLYGGLGVAIWYLHPRVTDYPNLDRVLCPLLAGLVHAAIVLRARLWLEEQGFHPLATLIRLLPFVVGLFGVILFLAAQFGPMALFAGSAWAQVFFRWALAS